MTTPRLTTCRRRRGAAVLMALALSLGASGCSLWQQHIAQNPTGAIAPVNAVALGEDSRVMLGGADVVAYVTEGAHRPGLREHRHMVHGLTFYFASDAHRRLFAADPERYMPQFGGFCANGIVYAIPGGGNPAHWKRIDGKLYLFGSAASLAAFELDQAANLALAHRYWREEVQGRHALWQRTKRLVMRVPHYRSDAALAEAVARSRGAQPAR